MFMFLEVLVIIIIIGLLALRCSKKKDMSQDSSEIKELPEVCVKEVLKKNCGYFENFNKITPKFDKVYEINGEVFREEIKIDNKLVNFEVWLNKKKRRKKMENDLYLDVNIQESSYGIIINSNILIPEAHWHTAIRTGEDLTCFLCDSLIESMEHVHLDEHKDKLNKYKPLKKFDLSIIRMIGDYYHCAICNEVFYKSDEHLSKKDHEEKMLYATNKASDVLFNFDLSENKKSDECNGDENNEYHFDRNRIYRVDCTSEQSAPSEQSEQSENFDGFYEYDFTPDVDVNNVNNGFSYATMAKKPAIAPKYIVSDDQKLKIRFDEWHMINTLDNNRFYCFTCKSFGHIGQKAQHCMEKEHLRKLKKCKVVNRYKKYFVRQVDHKLLHCALCNTLQVISDMDDHIQSIHDKKFKCEDDTYELSNDEIKSNNIDNSIYKQESMKCELNSTNPTKIDLLNSSKVWRQEMEINNISPGIFNDVIINQFNCNLRVSFLSYNVVIRRVNDYFCGICNLSLPEVIMIYHVHESSHVYVLKTIPFEAYFGSNLLRVVHHRVHCTLCNVVFDVPLINIHINDPIHVTLLNQALRLPEPSKINQNINTNTFKNENSTTSKNHNVSSLAKNVINSSASKNQTGNFTISKNVNVDSSISKTYNDSTLSKNVIDSSASMNQIVSSTASKNVNVDATASKNQDETDLNVDLNESFESEESYNYEHILLKLGNACVKVTYNSYNSLVAVGDGTRYCFVCSVQVCGDLKNHIESRDHVSCMKNCKFLNKYDKHLLRQMFLLYHCSICNVLFSKKDLSTHLSWHNQDVKINKKIRKRVRKSGIKLINVPTQKEEIYLKEQEPKVNVIGRLSFMPKCKSPGKEIKKKNKLVILGGKVLKISWDFWQGLNKCKDGFTCLLCLKDIKHYEVSSHVTNDWHTNVLDKTFDRQYFPNLIRQVSDTTLNCVTCNTSVSNKKHIISEHLNSQKHKNNYDIICSSSMDSYTDCNEDVLYL